LAKWNGYNFIPQNEIYFILKYIVGSVYEKQSLYQQNPIDKRTTAVDVKMILGPPFYLKTISDDNRACMDFVELQALYKYIK
jgi:hypothetical protein